MNININTVTTTFKTSAPSIANKERSQKKYMIDIWGTTKRVIGNTRGSTVTTKRVFDTIRN